MTGDRRLTDEERFPLLDDGGRRMLERLREHPHAPRWSFPCGDRLTREFCDRIEAFEADLRRGPGGGGWKGPDCRPDWLDAFAERCLRNVPVYRRRTRPDCRFEEIPPFGREELGREPWAFVPDGQPLDDLLAYYTSGTTGNAVSVLSHPVTAGSYLAALRVMLERAGIPLEGGPSGVAIAQVCAQTSTFTHATIMSYLGGAGYVKINLNPHEWRHPDDPTRFIEDTAPAILTGDPVAFAALAALPIRHRPRALVSSAMSLLPGLKTMLETRFGCPVFDVYSLNESRFVAYAGPTGHEILPHDLYVEILDRQGRNCAPGEPGEIVLTCGRNPFLPLLRYRTGDTAALAWLDGKPVLKRLEGRSPVLFLTGGGELVNSIDVTRGLGHLPLSQFTLRQEADGSLTFRFRGTGCGEEDIRRVLEDLFGAGCDIYIDILETIPGGGGKAIAYTSALSPETLLNRPWNWRPADGG